MAVSLVKMGFGFAILPFHDLNTCTCDELVFKPLSDPTLTRAVCIMIKRGRHLSKQATILKDLILENAPPAYVSETDEVALYSQSEANGLGLEAAHGA